MEQRVLSSENIVEGSAVFIFQLIQKIAKDNNGECNLALSGGDSPLLLYEALAGKINNTDGLTINVFQVDERYVDQNHEKSNQLMIKDHFLEPLKGSNKINYYFFNTDLPITDASNLYDELLSNRKMHLAIMGVGTDGHTASLIPGEKYPKIRYDRHVIHTKEYNGFMRLTMTHKALLGCEQLIFYIPGVYKRKITEKIVDVKNVDLYPAAFFLHKHPKTVLIREK